MAFTLQLGQPAPAFSLPGVDGRTHSLDTYKDCRVLVIVFSCNHCPYVIGSEDRMIRFAELYAKKRVELVAINSNESKNHPEDSFENMVARAQEKNFPFAYLRDESQDVARDYGALRTPHFFVFDEQRKLRYTGRMDDNPRTPGAETTNELTDAVAALLAGKAPAVPLTNPIGCNVKWKGKDRKWMPPEACDLI